MSWGLGTVKTVLLDSRPLTEKKWSYLLAFYSVDTGNCVDIGYCNGRKVIYFPGCYCWPMEKKQAMEKPHLNMGNACLLPSLKNEVSSI